MADFTWGANGARLTPEDIAARRKIADALAAKTGDGVTFAPGTRGAGVWTQGLAHIAKALAGGLEAREADQASKANRAEDMALQTQLLGGAVTPSAAVASSPMSAMPPRAAVGGPVVANDANASPGTVGMNQRLADLSYDFIDDNPGTSISNGHRSTADQARLYANRDSNPNPVAVPGTSRHERGAAVDIAGMSPATRAALPQYGLTQPVANDPPHVELAAAESALPIGATAAQGFVVPGMSAPASSGLNPVAVRAMTSPYASEGTKKIASLMVAQQMAAAAKGSYSQETDKDGNVWNVNSTTGERTVALKRDKPAEAPSSVREFEYYKANLPPDAKPMDYSTWSTAKARAAATNVTTNVGGGTDKQIYDTFDERSKEARAVAVGLTGLRQARSQLEANGGVITGAGADGRLYLQKIGALVGATDPAAIQNTETFRAAIAPQIAAVLKSTVGTANISNTDRAFAEKAAGGSIELDAGSIKRLLTIMEKASIARLQDHQEQLDAVYPDPVGNKRERAMFGIKVPVDDVAPPSGATSSGIKWSVQ